MKRRALTVHVLAFLFVWLSSPRSHALAFAYQRRSVFEVPSNDYRASRVALQTRGGSFANEAPIEHTNQSAKTLLMAPIIVLGKQYSAALDRSPILTKSITAGCIFALSDYLAQTMEKKEGNGAKDWTRLVTSAAVGLFCFGPAAHFWYGMVFRVFPGTGLVSTLQKASLGQIFFGPSFTCIFFAASLLQIGKFSFSNWFWKIRTDLPGTWVSGLCFWPLVDLVSYSLVPVNYIPLFVNICSLLWTIYLSSVANRAARVD